MFKYPSEAKDAFMSHISDDIRRLVEKQEPISLALYDTMRINSYEAKYIEPLLSDEAFMYKLENAIKNAKQLGSYELPRHYDEYLSTDGIAELLKRYKSKL